MSASGANRVVITGLGVVSSIGIGAAAFRDALQRGANGASPVRAFDTRKFPSHLGGEVHGFDPGAWVRRLPVEALGRSSQMAIAAARQALHDAGLAEAAMEGRACDVVFGTTDGEAAVFDSFCEQWVRDPEGQADSYPRLLTAEAIADAVQEEFGLVGDSAVLATACSAGNYALGYAFDKVRKGKCDIVLCGGSDSQCLKNFGGFHRVGALAPDACRPFDRRRKGILPGEGAGALVLESLAHARARNAHIYAEVLGYGSTCDGHHVMSPHKDGIVACNRDALARCGVAPAEVDYICAHGTATAANDVVETAAMREVFGERLPPMSSMKSMLGHTMGAASALSAIGCALALEHGFIPPTINFAEPDPECDIDCVPNAARPAQLRVVQNNAFAFGGNNAIALFRRLA